MPEAAPLQVLACVECGALDPGGRIRCAACGGELAQRAVSGRGTLLTWTLVRRPPAGFDPTCPMAVALVELEEGVRITASLEPYDPEPPLGIAVQVSGRSGTVPVARVDLSG